jgi:hypothetical protein
MLHDTGMDVNGKDPEALDAEVIQPAEQVKSGRVRSGKARMELLTSEERRQLARQAASKRWQTLTAGSDLPRATHKGEIPIGDTRIPCAVLDNGMRVLTETGITKALLGTRSGASRRRRMAHLDQGTLLPLFVAPGNLKPFITEELISGPLKPQVYLEGARTVIGFEATVLPAVCDIWLTARQKGALVARQADKAMNAEILMRGLARVGIIALVDEATGYQEVRDRFALQQILDAYIGKELAKWVKTFPDEFYEHVFRLKHWKFDAGSTKRPMMMAKLTADLIYSRLAPGVLDELRRITPKDEKGRRKNKLFQNLSADVGHPALRDHLSGVIFLLKANEDWDVFYRALHRVAPQFGKTMLLPMPDEPIGLIPQAHASASQPLS